MADIKINDLTAGVVSDNMQIETDIGGTTANKIGVGSLKTHVNASAPVQSVAGKVGAISLVAGDIAGGMFADARVAESNVTQHEAALSISNVNWFGAGLSVANGGTGASSSSDARANLEIDQKALTFGAITPDNNTVYLTSYAPYAFTINSVQNIATSGGTITAAIQINGTDVTGLGSISVSSTEQDVTASGANTVSIGDKVTLVLSSNASAADLRGALVITQ